MIDKRRNIWYDALVLLMIGQLILLNRRYLC